MGVQQRINEMTEYKAQTSMIANMDMLEAYNVEQHILKIYKHRQYIPLKKFGGYTECLSLSDDMVIDIITQINNTNTNR